MQTLFTIVRQADLDLHQPVRPRKAYRAIIFEQDQILLVKSRLYGEYKFPGGGAEPGERAFGCLFRETGEETGYHLKTRIRPFGITREYGPGDGNIGLFLNESHYYFCSVHPVPGPQRLSEYEIPYGYVPVWTTPKQAADFNDAVPDNPAIPWKKRETAVLRLLAAGRRAA